MSWGLALALLVAAQLRGATPAPRGPTDLDRTLVAVEGERGEFVRFVMRSEFVLLLRVELKSRGAPDALHVAVDQESVAVPILEQLASEILVLRDAERAGMSDAVEADLGEMRAYLLARIQGEAGLLDLLEATGTSAQEFNALVRRRVVAEHYLIEHHPRLIEASSQELRARWEAERLRAPTQTPATFGEARSELAARMARDAYPRALRGYLRALGGRVRIRAITPAPTALP